MRKNNKIERVGEINYNYYSSKMTIIEYRSARSITVQFENGYTVETDYKSFKTGCLKNPYDKSVFGVGYLGEGKYKACLNGRSTPIHIVWRGMIERCYSQRCQNEHGSYKGCTIDERWYNYQVFCNWYEQNYYEVDNEKMCLDKDILHKGNKRYSSETCIFVPNNINVLFTKSNAKRGKYPIGVFYHKRLNKYEAHCSDGNKNLTYLGLFDTAEDAFYLGYKPYKEKLIKEIADKYKNKIPQKLYEAMYRYEVEITD